MTIRLYMRAMASDGSDPHSAIILSASALRTESTLAFITDPRPLNGISGVHSSSYIDAMYSLYLRPFSLATARMRSVVPEPYWEDFLRLSAMLRYP